MGHNEACELRLPSRALEADLQVKPVYPLRIRVITRVGGFVLGATFCALCETAM